jgi:hypothetical protein
VLIIVIVAKFKEGAWLTVIFAPAAVLLLRKMHPHHKKTRRCSTKGWILSAGTTARIRNLYRNR